MSLSYIDVSLLFFALSLLSHINVLVRDLLWRPINMVHSAHYVLNKNVTTTEQKRHNIYSHIEQLHKNLKKNNTTKKWIWYKFPLYIYLQQKPLIILIETINNYNK
jgi:hypothetical protein